jgi:DDE superfamily endonuclease
MLGLQWDNVYNVSQTNVPFRSCNRRCEFPCISDVRLQCYGNGLAETFFDLHRYSKSNGSDLSRIHTTEDMEFAVQKSAWMDEEMMLKWIEKVWSLSTLAKRGYMTYLFLDECQSHMTSAVARACQSCNTEINIIPGGKLQAMDVVLNKPFNREAIMRSLEGSHRAQWRTLGGAPYGICQQITYQFKGRTFGYIPKGLTKKKNKESSFFAYFM